MPGAGAVPPIAPLGARGLIVPTPSLPAWRARDGTAIMNLDHLNPVVPMTGPMGFIGRQVVRELVSRGRPMRAMARPICCGGLNSVPSPSTGAHWGRYVARKGHQSLPSPSMGEGHGGGEVHMMPPIPTFPHRKGKRRTTHQQVTRNHAPNIMGFSPARGKGGKGIHPSGIGIVALPGKVQPSRSTFGSGENLGYSRITPVAFFRANEARWAS